MGERSDDGGQPSSPPETEPIQHFRRAVEEGRDWPTSLLEAMALWTAPSEDIDGRVNKYLIAGEAFDWLLLAERLFEAADGLVAQQDREDLLFHGCFPDDFDAGRFKHLLGVDKYRGYLNFHYGVTVEEALQLAAEFEVNKRQASNGIQYRDDYTDEAFARVYGADRRKLLGAFRDEMGYPSRRSITLCELKEFTYWLFKYRMKVHDRARIASDTHKGLEQLQRMKDAARAVYPEP